MSKPGSGTMLILYPDHNPDLAQKVNL